MSLPEALHRAQSFFSSRADEIDPESYLVYQYLERRYGAAHVDFDFASARDGEVEHEIAPYLRLIDRGVEIDAVTIAERRGRIDRLTLQALYCDRHPPLADFDSTLDEFVAAPAYRLTHALIAIQWLRENRCAVAASEAVLRAAEKGVARLAQFCATRTDIDDRYIEAVAVLYYLGRDDLVQAEWIDRIVAAQQPAGGWNESFHTSVLGLWVMLEANSVPEDTTQGWIALALPR